MNQEQEIYVGMYRDDHGECKLDENSISTAIYKGVYQFYDDMTEIGITDGSHAQDGADEQIEDLNQHECDMVTLMRPCIERLAKFL